MDWKRFSFRWRLQGNFFPELVQIEAYRQAALNLVLPPDWSRQLDELNRIRAVHGTTALEGNPLSETAVGEQLRREAASAALPEGESQEHRQVRNAGLAQNWVRKRFHPGSFPLQVSDILSMHRLLTEGSDDRNNIPGRLRTHGVVVGTTDLGGVHRGAPHEELPRLMDGFVEFVGSREFAAEHPVVRALLAHFFLVTIHPFGDGNGRVSRLVEAGILFQGAYNVHGFYGLSNYFYRHGDEYKTLLQKSRRSRPFDLSEFIAFGIKGFRSELKGINNFIKTRINRVMYRNALFRAFNERVGPRRRALNQREYGLLEYLTRTTEPSDPFAEEPSRRIRFTDLMSDPYVQQVYRKVTERTFRRELVRLFEQGFVKLVAEDGELTVQLDFRAIGKY
ncbi:MAG: Fic family protein [Acidobacteria bacterium]|nr:Fic family protein [Acidobacteriota bacterium]MYK79368.1 Fic family protein [Acidobacteriota bacterium]